MSLSVLAVQDLLHLSFVIAILWTPPYIPSYGRGGSQPVDDIVYLDRNASMENLRELQKYSKKLQFEATCCRLWANGILDQIMDEQEKVQTWIAGMTDELDFCACILPEHHHPCVVTVSVVSEQKPSGMEVAIDPSFSI